MKNYKSMILFYLLFLVIGFLSQNCQTENSENNKIVISSGNDSPINGSMSNNTACKIFDYTKTTDGIIINKFKSSQELKKYLSQNNLRSTSSESNTLFISTIDNQPVIGIGANAFSPLPNKENTLSDAGIDYIKLANSINNIDKNAFLNIGYGTVLLFLSDPLYTLSISKKSLYESVLMVRQATLNSINTSNFPSSATLKVINNSTKNLYSPSLSTYGGNRYIHSYWSGSNMYSTVAGAFQFFQNAQYTFNNVNTSKIYTLVCYDGKVVLNSSIYLELYGSPKYASNYYCEPIILLNGQNITITFDGNLFSSNTPQSWELAYLAADTYKQIHSSSIIKNFLAVNTINGDDGFRAVKYENSNFVIISYCGTDGFNDINADIGVQIGPTTSFSRNSTIWEKIGSTKNINSQINQAIDFYEKSTVNSNKKIIIIGHSLGGFLAQIIGNIYNKETQTFNAPGARDFAILYNNSNVGVSVINHLSTELVSVFGGSLHVGTMKTYSYSSHGIEGFQNFLKENFEIKSFYDSW